MSLFGNFDALYWNTMSNHLQSFTACMLVSLIVGCGLLADGWLCVQHVTECIDTCCIAAAGEIVVQVEVEACWLWSWDCCLLTWQGDKVKWHFLKRECVQGGWGKNRFPIRLISKQFQMLPHTPHPDLKYILGTASFSFSYFTSDFYQALDLCSCAMRYVILYLRNLNSIVA